MDWRLNQSVFQQINLIFGQFQVDHFASLLNNQVAIYGPKQVSKYVSWKAVPGAWTFDAMLLDWSFFQRPLLLFRLVTPSFSCF